MHRLATREEGEGGQSGRSLCIGGGLVQEAGGEQIGRLAMSGGPAPTESTKGGIDRGGSPEENSFPLE